VSGGDDSYAGELGLSRDERRALERRL